MADVRHYHSRSQAVYDFVTFSCLKGKITRIFPLPRDYFVCFTSKTAKVRQNVGSESFAYRALNLIDPVNSSFVF